MQAEERVHLPLILSVALPTLGGNTLGLAYDDALQGVFNTDTTDTANQQVTDNTFAPGTSSNSSGT